MDAEADAPAGVTTVAAVAAEDAVELPDDEGDVAADAAPDEVEEAAEPGGVDALVAAGAPDEAVAGSPDAEVPVEVEGAAAPPVGLADVGAAAAAAALRPTPARASLAKLTTCAVRGAWAGFGRRSPGTTATTTATCSGPRVSIGGLPPTTLETIGVGP